MLPACVMAHSEFDGAWKLDPPTLRIAHAAQSVISLKDGAYRCEGCETTIAGINAVGIGGTSEPFTAKLGGAAVPFTYRSGAGTTVSVQRVGPHSLRGSFMRHGKVTLTRTVTILPDGRTMQMSVHNLQSGSVTTMLHDKL